ncbi:MAG: OmpA family protein [Chitinophagales bacterium]|nr:OmpA family protein [Chitinophagales bacterium]
MKKLMFVIAACSLLGLNSCLVSKKKLKMEEAKGKQLGMEKEELQSKLDAQTKVNVDLDAINKELKDAKYSLEKDTTDCGTALRDALKKYGDLNKLYDETNTKSKKDLANSANQNQQLQLQLQDKQRQLDAKEDSLNALSQQLAEREKRVNELQDLLNKKDEAINGLKKRIENALLGFNKDELSVEVRDGKIYVSLAEQLLFKSGSTAVDPKGRDALNKLAAVLEKQSDIDIMVEGHTDNVPISTAAIKDNWDLSVLRATSIVRILTVDNKIDSKRVVPSGRGEFVPKSANTTKEGRALNRRTEIILSPNLDEIFKILNDSGK